jgi:DNA-binding response OmpR family regulator
MQEEKKKTLLLVEDDEDIRLAYAEVLRDAGYRVLEAADGAVGLEKVLKGDWDLLLLDIMLPGYDGIQILRQMKQSSRVTNRPVILLTNLGNEHIINECFDLGADGYLIKSQVLPDKIVAEVSALLDVK